MKETKEVTQDTQESDCAFINKVYEVKKQQLTFAEYNEFVNNVVSSIVDQETKTVWYQSLEISLRMFFAMTYLDIDFDNIEVDNGGALSEINYAKYCNINFEDYMPYIAYNQFKSMLISIDRALKEAEKQFTPTLENLIKSATNYTDNMATAFNDVDIKEVMKIFGSDTIKDLPQIIKPFGDKQTFDKIDELDLVEDIKSKISKDN